MFDIIYVYCHEIEYMAELQYCFILAVPETEVYMSSRFKRSLSGLMAVVTAASMSQLAPRYTAAEELAESLKVSFTSAVL